MLRWLPGADPATQEDGARLTKLALELFKKHLTNGQKKKATIAVGEVAGVAIAVVFHVEQKTADRLAGRLGKAGVVATGTSGDDHAEMVLHQRDPSVQVIGISNPKGPCSACERYFGNTPDGFANVYWDNKAWQV